jgi:tRNA (mo5U34)-methyltransferase
MSSAIETPSLSHDDPRLEGWYHTIELAPGISSRNAVYDHGPTVDQAGLPASLKGKTALDVGTADGFWAFEMERRGARVTAIDIARPQDYDLLPIHRARMPEPWHTATDHEHASRFHLAHSMRRSQVEYKICNVYDVSPKRLGTFDVVYCGTMLMHLFNPLQAILNIRSVTKEMAVIETATMHPKAEPVDSTFPNQPYAWFGSLDLESKPGIDCTYWRFSPTALAHMMIYAGFDEIEPQGTYMIRGPGGGDLPVTSIIGRVKS